MKKLTPSLIAITVTFSLYNSACYAIALPKAASNNPQCMINVPRFDRPLISGDTNNIPVNAESNQFEAIYPNVAIYQGDVSIIQGNRSIKANKVTIDSEGTNNRVVTLEGNIIYQDNLIQMKGNNASMNLNNNNTKMKPSEYHLVNRLGRGDADEMKLEENRYVILKNGSFTSCPINDSTWSIKGSTVIHDNKEQLLEVWNAIFRVGKIPVLYSPYLQLPTGDKRRSGLLMPDISYDSVDGVDFSIPFYWNIAPNYDATFKPRVLEKRGLQIQSEFRYLNELGLGTLAFDWLQHDSKYNKDRKNGLNGNDYDNNQHRWLFYWKNEELINYHWRLKVNASRVSDNQYLSDLSSEYIPQTAGYLSQLYQIGYNDENWDIKLSHLNFQTFHSVAKDNLYQTQPQLDMTYYNYELGPFKFKTFSQITHFVSPSKNDPKTWRAHIEPTLNYTLTNAWSTLSTEVGFMATHYNQDLNQKYDKNQDNSDKILDRNVNRFIPKIAVDGKIIFERDTTLIEGYTQTLEPRVKYIYIPYRKQSNILNYDSSLLQSDYIGLFRDKPYSGLDRIPSTNKISIGVTTRFYDNNKVERFNLSIGQTTYFTKSRTSENNTELDRNSDTGSITWATNNFWRINDDMIFRSALQYDTRLDTISLANTIFEYQPSNDKLVQLSYRYANHNYIDTVDKSSTYKGYKQDISQAGIMASWPLTNTITAVGSYYHDIKLGQTADSFIGLHYQDCCWGVTVQYGRKLTDWEPDTRSSKYENKFSIHFELQGLGRNSDARAKMLDFGKLPYVTAFE
ncbi:LPS assembly protein LptD [Gilliamella sp. wkB18]|uniref:LPS assembly protein LptD n=1 Tax=Gilliamella sp. wkB18 TaxID=3120260 RepID=UPI0004DD78F4|nr:LPS assembly protein LptD [Gilliamella apicola]KFA59895.1 Outer membrane protein Imp, required for envelope biogenesis / Organic solvent tolerance protein precursor [Gilliamella apicola]OCG61607.1 LPS assembly protein LptD [Gilliamella apicola]